METRDGRTKQDTERPVGGSGESGRNTKEMIKNGRSVEIQRKIQRDLG
jgi:hypothetical protein